MNFARSPLMAGLRLRGVRCAAGGQPLFRPAQVRCFTLPTRTLLGRRSPGQDDNQIYGTQQQQQHQYGVQQQQQHPHDSQIQQQQQSEYDALTPVARRYIARVYANTGAGAVSMLAGTSLMLFTPILPAAAPFGAGLLALVPLIGLSFVESPAARMTMFHSFAGLSGIALAGPVAAAGAAGILVKATALTAATFAGMTAAAMMAPRGAAMRMQGPLFAGMLGLLAMSLMSFILPPMPMMQNVIMYGTLVLFSFFISSDTSAMIDRANNGQEDLIGDSVNMLINIKNVFISIVRIFLAGGQDD